MASPPDPAKGASTSGKLIISIALTETIQERTYRLRNLAMDALVDLITDLKQAKAAGKDDKQLDPARNAQRGLSSCSILSKPKIPPAFTHRKKPRASSANPSTLRVKDRSHCATALQWQEGSHAEIVSAITMGKDITISSPVSDLVRVLQQFLISLNLPAAARRKFDRHIRE